MKRQYNNSGVALLWVLAVVVLTITTGVSLARLTLAAKVEQKLVRERAMARQIQFEGERAIEDWLQKESGDVVLPPDVTEPRIEILSDRWIANNTELSISIVAFDERGKVPLDAARRGTSLARELPSSITTLLSKLRIPADSSPGLDRFVGLGQLVFPKTTDHGNDRNLAIGSFVATHAFGQIQLNASTAPITLIENVLRERGETGIDMIVEARRDNKKPILPKRPAETERDLTLPKVLDHSDAYSFRIDLAVGMLRKSYWCVFVKEGSWRCTQRLSIGE